VNTLAKTNVTLPFLLADDLREEMKLIQKKLDGCIICIEALEAANLRNSHARNSYIPNNNTYCSTDESMYFPTFTPLVSSTSDTGTTYNPPTTNTCSKIMASKIVYVRELRPCTFQ
jgi:hypothetical protein